jgi:hypothetical protein
VDTEVVPSPIAAGVGRASPAWRAGVVVALAAAVLASAGSAVADRVETNSADQATAQRDVLHRSDLPTTVKWTTGNPDLNGAGSGTPAGCSSLNYDSPSVVDTGQAGSQFQGPGVLVENQVGLMAQTSMVGQVWRHVFGQAMTRCIGEAFSQGASGRIEVLSSTPFSLPRLAQYESAYRVLFQISLRGVPVRGAFDMVVLAGGRTLSMLMVMGLIGPASEQSTGEQDMSLIDLRFAEIIAGRAFSTGTTASALAA